MEFAVKAVNAADKHFRHISGGIHIVNAAAEAKIIAGLFTGMDLVCKTGAAQCDLLPIPRKSDSIKRKSMFCRNNPAFSGF